MMSDRASHKISQRHTRIVVVTVLLMGLFFSCIQIFLEYGRFQGEVQSKTQQIIDSVHRAAVSAAYNYDENLAKQIADGVMAFKPIYSFKIIDERGGNMVQAEREVRLTTVEKALAWLPLDDIEEIVSLYHENVDSEPVGALEVKVSVSSDRVLFFERAMIVLLSGIFRSLLLAGVLLFIFKKMLTVPFMRMSNDLQAVNIEKPSEGRLPDPDAYPNNEFREVMGVARESMIAIGKHLGKISETNEALEDRVVSRTKELRQSEIRLRRAQSMARLGNWEWRYKDRSTWWSDEIYKILDIKPKLHEEQLHEFFDKLTPESKKHMKASIMRLEETGERCNFEIDLAMDDGTFRTCAVFAEVEYSDKGTLEKLSGTLQDISRLKQAERAVTEKVSKTELLYEVARKSNETGDPERALKDSSPSIGEYLNASVIRTHVLPEFQEQFGFSETVWLKHHGDQRISDTLSADNPSIQKVLEKVLLKSSSVWELVDKINLKLSLEIEGFRSILALPVFKGDDVVAVIYCALPDALISNGREEKRMFQEIGEQLGLVFSRCALRQQRLAQRQL